MINPQTRLAEMSRKMKQHGLRMTPQRLAILKILSVSQGHPSVEDIYEDIRDDFPTISLATVYKTVTMLKQEGEVLELGFANASSRYDGNKPYPHPHLICIKCGRIIDPEVGSMDQLGKEITKRYGFNMISQRIDFFGICPQCQAEEEVVKS
jgi:Fur family peroxide stress response transcriptional regulator